MRHILFEIPLPYVAATWLLYVAMATVGGLATVALHALMARRRGRPLRPGPFALAGAVAGVAGGVAALWLVGGAPLQWYRLPVMGYGAMIVLGFLSGISLAYWRAVRCGENPEHILNLGLLALIGGIVGARLLFVLTNWSSFTGHGFFGDLAAMANVRAGGLVYYGGLLAGIGLALVYIVRKRLSTRRILDIVAPSLMLGLAFGRAGCTLNGCCWGGRCELDWAPKITFPYGSPAFEQQADELPWHVAEEDLFLQPTHYRGALIGRPMPAGDVPAKPWLEFPRQFLEPEAAPTGEVWYRCLDRDEARASGHADLIGRFRSLPVHPAQLYGIANGLLLCLVLNLYFRRRRREGQVIALMLTLYPISRFVLEAVRKDTDPYAWGLTESQTISLFMFVGGLATWWIISRLPRVARVPLSGQA